MSHRRSRRVQRRLKEARLPQKKLLSDLDGDALPQGIRPAQLHELACGEYIDAFKHVIAIGDSGTGKTHVSIGLGIEACRQSRRVRFYTAAELASMLEDAQEQHQLHPLLKRPQSPNLVIVDELGDLPLTQRPAELLFQAFAVRHQKGSVIVNSNLPFSEWDQIFKTEQLAMSMLDRWTHRAHVLEMNGDSYFVCRAQLSPRPASKPSLTVTRPPSDSVITLTLHALL